MSHKHLSFEEKSIIEDFLNKQTPVLCNFIRLVVYILHLCNIYTTCSIIISLFTIFLQVLTDGIGIEPIYCGSEPHFLPLE